MDKKIKTKKITKKTAKSAKSGSVSGAKKTDFEKIAPSLEEMLKAGAHFGHRTSRWNPKMEEYIFTTRNNVHILDLEKSRQKFIEALGFLSRIKEEKKTIVFVGTKVSAKEITKEKAIEAKMPYVSERWIGGSLTNFPVISKRLEYFRDLENKRETGELKKYTKKEQHEFNIELQKLEKQFGGLKNLKKIPDALLVIDVHKEKLAVKEANMINIPVVGLCDTNADPTLVSYPIPVNDDAISSLRLVLETIVKVLN